MSGDFRCRLCAGPLVEFANFGRQPMADAFVQPGGYDSEVFYRLAVGICESCTMVQIIEEIPNDQIFHKNYPYRSSGSAVMREHFRRTALNFLDGFPGGGRGGAPFVVEVGCNDGVMLNVLAERGVRHVGVEPCDDLAEVARARGVEVVNAYFDEETAEKIVTTYGTADIVFSANTVSHISHLDAVFRGVDILLAPEGLFIFEDPYFLDIIEKTSFDQIYDEHVYFFTVRSIQQAVERHGMCLVDVEHLPVHGGELRFTVARKGTRRPAPAVTEFLKMEQDRGLTDLTVLNGFAARAAGIRTDLVTLLRELRDKGKRVVGYGATAKSCTLLNYCGIGPDLVSSIYDNTPAKQGLHTPGSHIPIRSTREFADPYPDYALLLAWNHAEEIMENETGFREGGGTWILYVPAVRTE